MDQDIALEALSALCNAKITSVQKQRAAAGLQTANIFEGAAQPLLCVTQLIHAVLDGDETCPVSRFNFTRIQTPAAEQQALVACRLEVSEDKTGNPKIIDEDEFLDPRFNYNFTYLNDTETYYRGGEVYERPCGWYRFGLKVLTKYDENTWLGNNSRTTESVDGEWPVSYHGTSQKGAEGIIGANYKAGPRAVYGRGVYSTPYISEAIPYAKIFTSKKTGKKYRVILQNRINPECRVKHRNDKYWLIPVPHGTSAEEEQKLINMTIRPYGLLLREV